MGAGGGGRSPSVPVPVASPDVTLFDPEDAVADVGPTRRLRLTVAYDGTGFHGFAANVGVRTVAGVLAEALERQVGHPVEITCAGRTDTGVHGINQVIHFDTEIEREPFSWVRGVNRYLPPDIAIQWSRFPGDAFHARNSARGRRYAYLLLESAVRPAIESGQCGWIFRPLDQAALANFINAGGYERHLRQVTRKLAERRRLLRTLLEEQCADRLDIADSHAGMHLVAWVRDMPASEGDALIRAAAERKLALYSIAPCYLQPPDRTGLIMGYSAMSPGEIRDAVALFARCLALFPRRSEGERKRPALYLARSSG